MRDVTGISDLDTFTIGWKSMIGVYGKELMMSAYVVICMVKVFACPCRKLKCQGAGLEACARGGKHTRRCAMNVCFDVGVMSSCLRV